MEIFINNKKLEIEFNEDDNLIDIINSIKDKLRDENKVIAKLIGDGKEFLIEDIRDKKIKDFNRIEIEALHPVELTKQAILDVFYYLPKLKDKLKETISTFQVGKQTEALKLLTEHIDTLRWINTVLLGVEKIFNLKLDELSTVKIELENILKKLVSSLKDEDYVLLADLLEYELIPLLDTISTLVAEIIKLIDKKFH